MQYFLVTKVVWIVMRFWMVGWLDGGMIHEKYVVYE